MQGPLELQRVHVAYGETQVVRGVSLVLGPGEIGCLLGPSGCGKTTLLRAIAGFETVRQGHILVTGQKVSLPGYTLEPEKRGIGMVFQDFALFPHLSVARNIEFGISHLPAGQRRKRVDELLRLVALPDIGSCYPHELSGGQQQRVALIRALAPRPALLLLDEPFSSMDVDLRESLAREVRDILKREKTSALLVTHDQSEAFAMADRIAVMEEGSIRQWDSAYNLYHKPADRFVAGFIGQGVWLPILRDSNSVLQSEFGPLFPSTSEMPHLSDLDSAGDTQLEMLLRPDDVVRRDDGVPAEVMYKSFRGADILYRLRLPSGTDILYITKGHNDLPLGASIPVAIEMNELVLFTDQDGAG
ncbi:MAG: ABC transporter ATP-binding protein [Gammaproteobacteria bacterium]|nr:ABC transporter ATP-binding protein [Gammaproteobacteria bacterium]